MSKREPIKSTEGTVNGRCWKSVRVPRIGAEHQGLFPRKLESLTIQPHKDGTATVTAVYACERK